MSLQLQGQSSEASTVCSCGEPQVVSFKFASPATIDDAHMTTTIMIASCKYLPSVPLAIQFPCNMVELAVKPCASPWQDAPMAIAARRHLDPPVRDPLNVAELGARISST